MNNKMVSFLMGHRNHGRYVREAVRSIYQIDYDGPREIVIVDDASDDGSSKGVVQAIESSYSVKVVYLPDHKGLNGALNAGIDLVRGQYLVMIDSDDLIFRGFLTRMMRALEEHPESDFAYCHSILGDEVNGRSRVFPSRAFSSDLLNEKSYIPRPSLIRDVDKFRRIFPLDETVIKGNKHYMWKRFVFEQSAVGIYVPKALFYYRYHGENRGINLEKINDGTELADIWETSD